MGRAEVWRLARSELPPRIGGRSPRRGVSTCLVEAGRPIIKVVVVVVAVVVVVVAVIFVVVVVVVFVAVAVKL